MNAALVKIDVAAATLGWSAGKLFDLVDGGTLLEKGFVWVFNLANDPHGDRRDLRFWMPEIQARCVPHGRSYGHWEIEHVIAKVLPKNRTNFHAGEVDQLFQIRHRTRIDLHGELFGTATPTAKGTPNFYPRTVLAAFLKRRWLGALYERRRLSTERAN